MATLQAPHGPTSRVEAGNHVLHAAESIGTAMTKPIGPRLATFRKVHDQYMAADDAVKEADAAVRAQKAKVAEADVTQDEAIETLSCTVVGEGLPRLTPFKPLGFASPSSLKKMEAGAEARELLRLAAAVKAHKPALTESRKVAAQLEAAAKGVLVAVEPIADLERKRREAVSKRDALEQGWETAFAALKRGARAAADEGAAGLFEALFGSAPKPKRTRRPKTATPPNEPNPAPA